MVNRSQMPEIREITNLVVPSPELWHLSNGVPVYESNLGTQDIIKLELVFFAGRPFEKKRLASRTAAALLREGTKSRSSEDIAETLDYYGGSLSATAGMDVATVSLYSLTKHFEKMLPLMADIISEPVFPQKELDAFIERNKQRLKVDLTKNDVVGYRKFTEYLFGKNHPYGYNSYAETYSALQREDLVAHFEDTFTTGNCLAFLSGKINADVRRLVEQELGHKMLPGERKMASLPAATSLPVKIHAPLPDTLQKAIRIGCPLFNRHHPDHNGMYVLNTILGGYFGSRLMTNIREKKGYTYNIYSSHDAMMYDGYFCVGTEVGNEFMEPTLTEIYREMQRLQDRVVRKEEMEMVRNYLLGSLLTNLDGPFNIAEVVKSFVIEDLPLSAFEELVQAVKTVTPRDLKELARKYFQKEKMWEVVV